MNDHYYASFCDNPMLLYTQSQVGLQQSMLMDEFFSQFGSICQKFSSELSSLVGARRESLQQSGDVGIPDWKRLLDQVENFGLVLGRTFGTWESQSSSASTAMLSKTAVDFGNLMKKFRQESDVTEKNVASSLDAFKKAKDTYLRSKDSSFGFLNKNDRKRLEEKFDLCRQNLDIMNVLKHQQRNQAGHSLLLLSLFIFQLYLEGSVDHMLMMETCRVTSMKTTWTTFEDQVQNCALKLMEVSRDSKVICWLLIL
jgi:hypothetical protein